MNCVSVDSSRSSRTRESDKHSHTLYHSAAINTQSVIAAVLRVEHTHTHRERERANVTMKLADIYQSID